MESKGSSPESILGKQVSSIQTARRSIPLVGINIRTIASIIVLGLLGVGSIENLVWYTNGKEQKEKSLYTKPVEKIVLLGERHSGTNWITDHLTECFHGDHLKVCETCKTFSFIVIKVYYSLARCTLNGR